MDNEKASKTKKIRKFRNRDAYILARLQKRNRKHQKRLQRLQRTLKEWQYELTYREFVPLN